MKHIITIAKGAGIFFFGLLFSKIIGYLFRILVSHIGVGEYGIFNLGLTVFNMLTLVASVGLLTGLVRFVSYHKEKKDKKAILKVIGTATKISIPVSSMLAILLFIFAGKIALFVFNNTELIMPLRFFSIAIPFYNLGQIMLAVIDAYRKIKYSVFISKIIEPLFRLIITAIFIYSGFHLMGALFGFVISTILAAILAFYFAFKIIREKLTSLLNFSFLFDINLLSYSWPLLFSKLVGVLYGNLDTLMIGIILTTYNVGIYNAALPTALLLLVIPQSFTSLYLPVVTQCYARKESASEEYDAVVRWISFFTCPVTLFFVLFSSPIIISLFGEAYKAAAPCLSILALGQFFLGFTFVSGNILATRKETKKMFLIYFSAMLFNLFLNLLLIPVIGIIGAAIGSAISHLFSFICLTGYLHRIIKRNPFNIIHFKIFLSSFFVFMSIFFFLKYTSLILHINNLFVLLLIAIISFLIYFLILVLIKGIHPQDKKLFFVLSSISLKRINLFKKEKN